MRVPLVIWVINLICQIVIWTLLARAIMSWFVNPYKMGVNHPLVKLYSFICQVTEPLLKPARKLMSRFNTGVIDLSLFVTVIFIYILQRMLIRLVLLFMF